MRLSVIIPAFNEGATVAEIIRRVRALPLDLELILVDDGSTDGTRELALAGLDHRLRHERNRGKGAAVHSGLAHATGDVVVVQDADLEYQPNDLIAMLTEIERGAEVVYGSRILGNNPISHLRFYLGGRLLSLFTTLLYGVKITDEPTGYKMFRREVINALHLERRGFDFCAEVTAKLLRRGHTIVEVPIRYQPRTLDEGKKIRFSDGVSALFCLLRYRF